MEIIHPQSFSKIIYHSVLKGIGAVIARGIKIAECSEWEYTINLYAFPQDQESVIWGESLSGDEFESFIITFAENELVRSIQAHSIIADFFRNNYSVLSDKSFKAQLAEKYAALKDSDTFKTSVLPAAQQTGDLPEENRATVVQFKFSSENTDNDRIIAEQIIRQHYGENLLALAHREDKDEFAIGAVVSASQDLEDNLALDALFLECGLKSAN